MRHQEWHVTVEGDPIQWYLFCHTAGIKPLYIELNNFERQLMCASEFNPTLLIQHASKYGGYKFNVVRTKHEVSKLLPLETPTQMALSMAVLPAFPQESALYWECHIKLDGPFQPGVRMGSRDLYRENRWYITRRESHDFDEQTWVANVQHWLPPGQRFAGSEYEAAILDTNAALDARWQ